MGLQKFRSDTSESQADGAILWSADWQFGPTLSVVKNCRWESLSGNARVTVYVTGEADTFYSIPAKCRYHGTTITGYLTLDTQDNIVFRHTYY